MLHFFSKCRAAALVLWVGLTACTGGGTEPEVTSDKAPPVNTPLVVPATWVVLGSSTAAGSGASPGKSWVSQMQDNIAGVQVLNLAVGAAPATRAYQQGRLPRQDVLCQILRTTLMLPSQSTPGCY